MVTLSKTVGVALPLTLVFVTVGVARNMVETCSENWDCSVPMWSCVDGACVSPCVSCRVYGRLEGEIDCPTDWTHCGECLQSFTAEVAAGGKCSRMQSLQMPADDYGISSIWIALSVIAAVLFAVVIFVSRERKSRRYSVTNAETAENDGHERHEMFSNHETRADRDGIAPAEALQGVLGLKRRHRLGIMRSISRITTGR